MVIDILEKGVLQLVVIDCCHNLINFFRTTDIALHQTQVLQRGHTPDTFTEQRHVGIVPPALVGAASDLADCGQGFAASQCREQGLTILTTA